MTQVPLFDIDDTKATIRHIRSLAYNRSTSSSGDIKACVYIENQLKSVGLEPKSQYFSFDSPIRILVRITYVIILSYMVLYKLLLIVAAYFAIKYLFATTRNFSLVKKQDSKNLLTTIPAISRQKKRPVIILTAHYDSFSANIPYRLQNIFFFLFRIIIVPYFIITVSFALLIVSNPSVYQLENTSISDLIIISSIIEFVVVLLIFLLIYNTQQSKGAIDNASGVSVLIEISRLLARYPLDYYDVIVIFTGSEEWGLLGSKNYCKRNLKYLNETYDLDKSFNINVDMVGSYIGMIQRKPLFKKVRESSPLNNVLDQVAKDLDIKITKHLHIINPKTDHRSFKKLARKTKSKFQVLCFHSDKDSKYIHSRRDTPERCNSEVLNNTTSLIFNTLSEMDKKVH